MKHVFCFPLHHFLLLILIINITVAATRDFPTNNIPIHYVSEQGRKVAHAGNVKGDQNAMDLMGLVEERGCDEDGDEECVKRRLTSEAHLDYIYTQHHHKP